jgi:hypothetical protein
MQSSVGECCCYILRESGGLFGPSALPTFLLAMLEVDCQVAIAQRANTLVPQ